MTLIKKTALYGTLFSVCLSFFLLATLPANFVWQRFIEPRLGLKPIGLDVLAVDGSIWDGRARIRYQQLEFIADWDFALSGLVSAAIPIELDIQSHAGLVGLTAFVGIGESRIELKSADIDLQHLTPLLRRQHVELSGQLVVKNLEIEVVDRRIASAAGLFSWSGGEIVYPVARQTHKRVMPAFRGVIETQGDGMVYVGIRDDHSDFDLIEGTLAQDGTALVKVRRRVLDLADEAWPKNSSEKDVIFKVKKVIY